MDHKVDLTRPIAPLTPPAAGTAGKKSGQPPQGEASFKAVLEREIAGSRPGLKFSQHARERLVARQIQLNSQHLERLGQAVDTAARKGARDSLVLMDNLALVVSVPNRTVVTAIDGQNIKGHVFTNIDSAVIA